VRREMQCGSFPLKSQAGWRIPLRFSKGADFSVYHCQL